MKERKKKKGEKGVWQKRKKDRCHIFGNTGTRSGV
jgi:hypothetical protein